MLGLTCTQSNLERYLWRLRSSANHGNVRVSSFELRSASDRQFWSFVIGRWVREKRDASRLSGKAITS
jgi:hypothetical protein